VALSYFKEVLVNNGPVIALIFQASLLFRFLDRRNRDYPLAIVFSLVLLLLTAAAHWFDRILMFFPKDPGRVYTTTLVLAYSAADLFMHILLLALMLQLIWTTLKSLNLPTRIVFPLAAISVLIAVTAYNYFSDDTATPRLLQTRQIVSFWMVLLNLYWWTLLLRKRKLDRRVLLLSAGIGLMMTGQVIGDGMTSMGKGNEYLLVLAIIIMYGAHFAALFTWFKAFSPSYSLVPQISPTAK